MICLTGDIHHASLRTNDQAHSDRPEADTARTYVEIAKARGIKLTLFVTGKAFVEQRDVVQAIAQHPHVEIGGHTFRAFSPDLLYRGFGFLFGTHCGPAPVQRWDIRKTLDTAETVIGTRPIAWRDHAYICDANTPRLLAEAGIQVVSDEVAAAKPGPERLPQGLVSLPINVLPDHEHLYHAHRTAESVPAQRRPAAGGFPGESYPPTEWLRHVKEQVAKIDDAGGVATILAHPLCMYLADGFKTFEALCDFLAPRESAFAGETAAIAEASGIA